MAVPEEFGTLDHGSGCGVAQLTFTGTMGLFFISGNLLLFYTLRHALLLPTARQETGTGLEFTGFGLGSSSLAYSSSSLSVWPKL